MVGMPKPTVIDLVRTACMGLPEAEERPFGGHTAPSFRVRDKFFVMTSEDQRSMTLKVPFGVNSILVGAAPEQFFLPAYVASRAGLVCGSMLIRTGRRSRSSFAAVTD